MRSLFISLLFCIFFIFSYSSLNSQTNILSIEEYKLANGLTVYLAPNPYINNITGSVICRVGKKDDPPGSPGMTHCLEHMLFKGTTELGTSNWQEEKPHYDKLVGLYREIKTENAEIKKSLIRKQIDEESKLANKYIIKGELFDLIKNISTEFNGLTYFDYTTYFNTFSPNMLEKWAMLYSHRFENPIFRGFVTELDVLSQEYYVRSVENMNIYDHILREIFHQVPEAKLQESIKNISLSDLIDFYNQHYMANNMCVILSGNFKTEEVKPIIEKYFSKLKNGTLPEQRLAIKPDVSNKRIRNAYRDATKSKMVYYNTIPVQHPDFLKLRICVNMVANDRFGLLAEQVTKNKISSSTAIFFYSSDYGFTGFLARNTNFLKIPSAENIVKRQTEKLINGQFTDTLLESIKQTFILDYYTTIENSTGMSSLITELFAYGLNKDRLINYPSIINSITRSDITRVARENFLKKPVVLSSKKFTSRKKAKATNQHNYEIDSVSTFKSAFVNKFDSFITIPPPIKYVNFDTVIDTIVDGKVKISYSKNPVNDVFVMKFIFKPIHKVSLAINKELNIFNSIATPNRTKIQFAKAEGSMGCYQYWAYDRSINNYTLVVEGRDSNFTEIAKLYSELLSTPKLNEVDRKIVKRQKPWIIRWLYFGKSADSVSNTVKALTHSLAEVQYCGTKDHEQVIESLGKAIDFKALSAENNKETNDVIFSRRSWGTEILYQISGKSCSPSDKIKLQLINEYLRLKLTMACSSSNALRNSVNINVDYPKIDSGVPTFRLNATSYPSRVLELSFEPLRIVKQKMDSVVFELARVSLKNTLISELPQSRNTIDKVNLWKTDGYKADSTTNSFDIIDRLTYSEINSFYTEVFKNKPSRLQIFGLKREIGRKNYKKFIKEFEYFN